MGRVGGVRYGVAGWSYPDWRGRVYPERAERGFDPLAFLARHVDVIEINVTFYRPIAARTVASWARRCGRQAGFLFTAKAPRAITHDRPDPHERSCIAIEFVASLAPLAELGLLGALLMQFPYSFRNTRENLDYVEAVAADLSGPSVVLEVRHDSWLEGATLRRLRDLGVGFCNVDQPAVGSSIGRTDIATSDVGYVRLHGRNERDWFRQGAGRDARYDYLYTVDELDGWKAPIGAIAGRTRHAFVVTNNHFQGKAVVNALELAARARGEQVAVPPRLLAAYPRLGAIARALPPDQPSLFP